MTTAVRATTRDAWADATHMATHEVLDDEVAAARRRAWVRRALPILAGLGVVLAADLAYDSVVGAEAAVTPVWDVPSTLSWAWFGLFGIGFVLTIVANIRSSAAGLDLKFVGPADLLPRGERVWGREQIYTGRAVPADRRTVVVATARRMSDEGRTALLRVGQVCILAWLPLSSPTPFTVVLMTGLIVWTLVDAIRDQLRARRARSWLAQHDDPGAWA